VIIEDSAPAGVLLVGRLARGLVGETRRVVHVFAVDPHGDLGELLRTRCGEALSRPDVEWVSPGTGMPCEPCLGLTGVDRSRSPRRELGV
jgi:hypothetical protein